MTQQILKYDHLYNPNSARGKFYTIVTVEDGGDYFVLTNFGPGDSHSAGLTSGQLHAQRFSSAAVASINADRKAKEKIKRGYSLHTGLPGVIWSRRIQGVCDNARGTTASQPQSTGPVLAVDPFSTPSANAVEEFCRAIGGLLHADLDTILMRAPALRQERDRILAEAAKAEATYELLEESLRRKLA